MLSIDFCFRFPSILSIFFPRFPTTFPHLSIYQTFRSLSHSISFRILMIFFSSIFPVFCCNFFHYFFQSSLYVYNFIFFLFCFNFTPYLLSFLEKSFGTFLHRLIPVCLFGQHFFSELWNRFWMQSDFFLSFFFCNCFKLYCLVICFSR